MTSPDKRVQVPPGGYTGGSIRNLPKVTWEAARASIMSDVMQSFAGVDAIGANLGSITDRALDAAASAQTDATDAQVTATAARSTSVSNATAIAELQADKTQNEVGGAAVTDKFESWDAITWRVGQWSSGGHQVPDMVGVDNQVGIAKTGHTSTGANFALYRTPLMTDSQSVSVVLGRPNQASAFTGSGALRCGSGILLRAAEDLSSFVIAQIGSSKISLQRGTLVDGQLVMTVWNELAGLTLSTGDTITVSASGSLYEVLIDGVTWFEYQDTAGTSPVGAGNRMVGFFSGCAVSSTWAGTTFDFGFDLESFAAADTSSPPMVGTGWSLYRQSADTVDHIAGNVRYGPVFDTLRYANKINLLDLASGQIQVTKTGWYVMSVGAQWYQACGTGSSFRVALWSAPAPDGLWRLVRHSGEVEGSAIYRAAGSFVVFAGAGSVWAPGYYIADANEMYGDSFGTNVYFDGTLCSYS